MEPFEPEVPDRALAGTTEVLAACQDWVSKMEAGCLKNDTCR
jgi:hypothetical protein